MVFEQWGSCKGGVSDVGVETVPQAVTTVKDCEKELTIHCLLQAHESGSGFRPLHTLNSYIYKGLRGQGRGR